MDGLLVIEFPMDNFVLGSQTVSSFLVFGRTSSVIMNSSICIVSCSGWNINIFPFLENILRSKRS